MEPCIVAMVANSIVSLFNTDSNIENQKELAEKNRELQQLLEQSRQQAARQNLERSAEIQREIAYLGHTLRLKEQQVHFEGMKRLAEWHIFLQKFPLETIPSVLTIANPRDNDSLNLDIPPVPLQVIMAPGPPEYQGDLKPFVEQRLFEFINRFYSPGTGRPVIFYKDGWRSGAPAGDLGIQNLFYVLRGQPILVIDPAADPTHLHINVAFWRLGTMDVHAICRQKILDVPYRKLLADECRAEVAEWKRLTEASPGLVQDQNFLHNAEILDEETQILAARGEPERLGIYSRLKASPYCHVRVANIVAQAMGLVIGLFADAHYFMEYNETPILPHAIHYLTNSESTKLVKIILEHYRQLYSLSIGDDWLGDPAVQTQPPLLWRKTAFAPDLYVRLAESVDSSFREWQEEQCRRSMISWLLLRGRDPTLTRATIPTLTERICRRSGPEDIAYLERLRQCLAMLGDRRSLSLLDVFLIRYRRQVARRLMPGPRLDLRL